MREAIVTRSASAAFAAILIASLMGCETAVSDDGSDDMLTQRDWAALTIAGKAVIKPGSVTLSFGEGRVSGRGSCNRYSGPVEYGKGKIKVGALISTKMACVEEGLMQQESAYLNALEAAQTYKVGVDGKLTIGTKAGALVYEGAARQVRPEN
jgi:heat shock protein HslJ